MTTSTLMTLVTNSMSLRCRETKHVLKRTFIQKDAYFILLHGCSFVEDFNKFRQETIKGTERASPIYTLFHR